MVAKIISGKSLKGALNYNEHKVAQGKAELISESGFQKDIQHLTFYDKLKRLDDLANRNSRVKTNTVHISLNFAVGENLSKDQLTIIASDYMKRIGFDNQSYLVYLHKDAGHPHIHIVSTNVKSSGERISLHNIGKNKSEDARISLEKKYGLVAANKEIKESLNDSLLRKVEYGKTDTKRAISNVINTVSKKYKFTSLPELNAVLNEFNVVADRGSKESRMYAKNGLLYWCLDNAGNKVGVPIKASDIHCKPTLKNLEEKFRINEALRYPHKERLRNVLDGIMQTKASEAGFKRALQAKGISVLFRKNDEVRLYGITFIDHQSKAVFNGSDLGKAYSAAQVSNWLLNVERPREQSAPQLSKYSSGGYPGGNNIRIEKPVVSNSNTTLLADLVKSELDQGVTPEISRERRKKRRKRLIS